MMAMVAIAIVVQIVVVVVVVDCNVGTKIINCFCDASADAI